MIAFNDFVNKQTDIEQRIQQIKEIPKNLPKSLVLDIHLTKAASRTYAVRKPKAERSENNHI